MTIQILLLSLFSLAARANSETIVVGGKPYQVTPTRLKVCGEPGSPEFAAAKFLMQVAQANGEKIYDASCAARVQKKCSAEDTVKFGVQQVFTLVRGYPSGLQNTGCKELRTECEKRCKASKAFEDLACVIECNQYESWNP